MDSIRDALLPQPDPFNGFHREVYTRIAHVTGLSPSDVVLAGFAARSTQMDSTGHHIGQMLLDAQRAWETSVAEVESFLRWLTAANVKPYTSPWALSEGRGAYLVAFFHAAHQRPSLATSLTYLCAPNPVLRVGRELPTGWQGFDEDTEVRPEGIFVTQPIRSVLSWKRFHPCTAELADRLVVQNAWHGTGDVATFLRDAGFSRQPCAVPRSS